VSLIDIAEPALVINSGETISKVTKKMLREKKYEAVVKDGNDFRGLITTNDLAKRNIDNPEETKIDKFIRHVSPVPPGTNLTDVISSMLINDYKSVPLIRGKNFFILTNLDILKKKKNSLVFKQMTAADVMKTPFFVSADDSLETIMSMLRVLNISRLPVLNKNGGIEGLIDTRDLLKTFLNKERGMIGYGPGEKIKMRNVRAISFMKKNIPRANPHTSVKELINIMIEKNTRTIIIEEEGKVKGIVTPKLILKKIGAEVGGVYVNISGAQKEDKFIRYLIDKEIKNEIKKLAKFTSIAHMNVHIKKYRKTGKRIKYSIKARLITERGMFFAESHTWDITKAMKSVLQKLERETIKKKNKKRRR